MSVLRSAFGRLGAGGAAALALVAAYAATPTHLARFRVETEKKNTLTGGRRPLEGRTAIVTGELPIIMRVRSKTAACRSGIQTRLATNRSTSHLIVNDMEFIF